MMVFNGKLKCRARLAKQAAATLGEMRMETKPSKTFARIKQGLDEALEFAKRSESKAVACKLNATAVKGVLETDFERKKDNVRQAKLLDQANVIPCNSNWQESLVK